MAPDHHTSERVYRHLKQDLLDGRLGSGRLNIPALEQRYSTSATPVRETLLRLTGEDLIDLRATGGFEPRPIGPQHGADLYLMMQDLITLAARSADPAKDHSDWSGSSRGLDPPVDALFLHVAKQTGNSTLVSLVDRLNDRLHRLRRAEEKVLDRLGNEYSLLSHALTAQPSKRPYRMLATYHRRRLRALPALLRAIDG